MKRSSWLPLFLAILSASAVLGACGDESTTLPDSSGEGGGGTGGSSGAGGAGLSGGGQAGTAGVSGGQGGSASGHAGSGTAGVSGGGQAGEGTAGVSGGGQAGEGTAGVSGGGQAGEGTAGVSGGGQAGAGGEAAGGAGGSAGGGGSAGAGGQKTPVTSCQQAKSTDCFGNPDCADSQLCTNLGTEADPVPCCADGPRGTIADGAACTLSDDCQSGLCVPVDKTHSYCSTTCNGDQDCKAPFAQCISVFGQSKFDWCFPKS